MTSSPARAEGTPGQRRRYASAGAGGSRFRWIRGRVIFLLTVAMNFLRVVPRDYVTVAAGVKASAEAAT